MHENVMDECVRKIKDFRKHLLKWLQSSKLGAENMVDLIDNASSTFVDEVRFSWSKFHQHRTCKESMNKKEKKRNELLSYKTGFKSVNFSS